MIAARKAPEAYEGLYRDVGRITPVVSEPD
jgi:hypothetical protein